MFVTSRYEIGQRVYFMENNQPKTGHITAINFYGTAEGIRIDYFLDSSSNRLSEDELYYDSNYLLNSLCKSVRLIEEALSESESDDESVDSRQP